MANELKPCPFCGAPDDEIMIFADPEEATDNSGPSRRVQCAVCNIEAPFYPSEAEAIAAWNTRPAPAATDTGLVTFSVEMLRDYAFMKADPEGDYVARSQAEAIIAAKDAELKAAQEHGDMWFKDYSDLRETFKLSEIERKKLEADNAALTVRVKELEVSLETEKTLSRGDWACQRDVDHMSIKLEVLETQLAAARKALETEKALADRLASALEYIDDYSLSYPDLGTVTAVAQPALEAHSAARAALEDKP